MGWLSNLTGVFTGSTGKKAGNDAFNQLMSSQNQALSYQDPWAKAGGSALFPLTGLIIGKGFDYGTGKTTDLTPDQRQNLFTTSPGYQFRLDQAMKAVQASQAAKGNLLSGGAMKELGDRAQGVASDEYSNYLNQLFQLAGIGQTADTNKSNIVTGMANPLAEARYSSSIAKNVAGNKILNTGLSIMGMGAGAAGGASNGGGTYNPAIFAAAA